MSTHQLWLGIGAAVVLVFIIGHIYQIFSVRRRVAASVAWAIAPGEIIASSVSGIADVDSTETGSFHAALLYRYSVFGRVYEGTRIGLADSVAGTRRLAEEQAGKYPVGYKVDVHYDPKKPEQAILEASKPPQLTVNYIFLFVFLVIEAALCDALLNGGKPSLMASGLPWFSLFLPFAACCAGLLSIASFLTIWRRNKESASWPAVVGKIVSSGVTPISERDAQGRVRKYYRADVYYAYSVGGREYHNSKVGSGWNSASSLSRAKAIAERYSAQARVPVHYDPSDPATSVLEPTNRTGSFAPIVFGALFFGSGLLMFWMFTHLQWV